MSQLRTYEVVCGGLCLEVMAPDHIHAVRKALQATTTEKLSPIATCHLVGTAAEKTTIHYLGSQRYERAMRKLGIGKPDIDKAMACIT